MSNVFLEALSFLVKVAIDLCYFLLLLRLLFHIFRVNFYNPISQFIYKTTNSVLIPLHRIIPNHPKIDPAILVLLLLLKAIELSFITLLTFGKIPYFLGVGIWSIAKLFSNTLDLFFFAIILIILQSWLNPRQYNSLTDILDQITEPLLRLVRNKFPPFMGLDLSPLLILIGLKLTDILIVNPLLYWGLQLATPSLSG